MNDSELIERTLLGDDEAFGILMERNQNKIYYQCLKMVHDEEIAQDLTQETFLHAYRHLDTFKGKARFSTWIWKIAYNLTLNYLKKQQGRKEKEYKEEILVQKPQSAEPEAEVEEKKQQIREHLGELSPKHRIVFELYFFENMPQKEIAAKLNLPHGTVRSRLHYARKKMQDLLYHSERD